MKPPPINLRARALAALTADIIDTSQPGFARLDALRASMATPERDQRRTG